MAHPYRRRFDLDAFRKRFKETLAARFVLRFHMSLILGLVLASGFVVSRALYLLGADSMALRYLAAVVVGYGVFFALIRLWLHYLADALATEAPELRLAPDAVAEIPEPRPQGKGKRKRGKSSDSKSSDWVDGSFPDFGGGSSGSSTTLSSSSSASSFSSSSGSGGGGFDLDLDEGAVAILIVILIAIVAAVVFGVAIYFVWEAPVILGEAAFELVLVSSLARASRKIDSPGWTGSVFRTTWKGAAFVLLLAVAGGWIAQGLCPGANTLPTVIKQCVKGEKPSSTKSY